MRAVRTLKLPEEFVTGFLAEGFSHRFKVMSGFPSDSKIERIDFDQDIRIVSISVSSHNWRDEDLGNPEIHLIIHELPN
jgi:hypothetical protein